MSPITIFDNNNGNASNNRLWVQNGTPFLSSILRDAVNPIAKLNMVHSFSYPER